MKKGIFASLFLLGLNVKAQTPVRTCGTPLLPQQFESWVQSLSPINSGKLGGGNIQSVFNIPVIVHVIHNNEAVNSLAATSGNNLNAAQIIDQINILNKDFNGKNTDTILIPAVFKPLLGKFQVNFCMAVVNPTGGVIAEPGIDRINRVAKGWSAPPYAANYMDATIKPNSIWDPNKYLNIWVCPLSNGLLGYATFPNPGASGVQGLAAPYGTATSDGVVALNTSFGSIGTAQFGQYNKGRTATHEIGHWIGLRHIWGDGTCATDYCNDTPPAQNANYNCPNFPYKLGTCGGNTTGEMTMNYMDYTDDACMYMFTADQKNRAQLILINSPIRAALITSTVCNLPAASTDIGISYILSPTYSQVISCPAVLNPVINLTNFGAITLTSAVIAYNVNGVNTQTLNWTGNIVTNSSTTFALPQMTVAALGSHVYSVNVSSPNGGADANLVNNNNTQFFSISGPVLSVTSATTCPGVPVTIGASGTTSYSWSTGANTATVSLNPLLTTVYTVTGSAGSCSATKTVAITVKALPTITVNNQSGCKNTTVNITASGANTYSWSTGSTSSGTSLYLTATTVLTVTGYNSPLCFTNKTVTVTANPLPTSTLSATNVSCAVCTNATVSAVASGGTPPYTYIWTAGGVNIPQLDDVGTGCYSVTITDALGCKSVDSVCVIFDVGLKKFINNPNFVTVSPNPSEGLFTIRSKELSYMKIEITDALGRLIKEVKINSGAYEINLSAEAKGVYYLKVISDDRFMVVKLLRE